MPVVNYLGRNVLFTGAYRGSSYDCINHGRFYEQTFLDYVRSLNLRGVYLDIGTNIGNHALFFALFCQADRVIGFEPMASWRARAVDNLKANGCNVDVHPVGLLDSPQELVFNPYGTPYVLECTTLDAILPDLSGVSFIKMDIEGSEPRALLGGREFFKRNRPLIFAECLGETKELAAAAAIINYRLSGFVFRDHCSPMVELVPN